MGKIVAKRTVRDQDVFMDDAIEMFLDVEGKRSSYCQVVVNSLGAVYDGHGVDGDWNASGIRTGAVKGMDSWALEVYLPFADVGRNGAVKTGVTWYADFMRNRMHAGWQFQRWSTLGRPSHHDFAAFGKLKFVE